MENNLNNQIYYLKNEVNNISVEVQNEMQQQASLLADSAWEYGKADFITNEIELICKVMPKEYSPQKTTATLQVANKEYPMTLENGVYTATVKIPLVQQTTVLNVFFETDEVIRTEKIDWNISPRYDYLPLIYGRFEGSNTSQQGLDGSSFHYEGTVRITVEGKQNDNKIQSLTLIEVLDGKEIGRTPIDMGKKAQHEYAENEQAVYEEAFDSYEAGTYYYPLDKEFEIPRNSSLELYVEGVDSYGLHYRALAEVFSVDESGNPCYNDDQWMLIGAEPSIYDEEGNLLFDIKEEYRLYK